MGAYWKFYTYVFSPLKIFQILWDFANPLVISHLSRTKFFKDNLSGTNLK